MVGNEPRSPGAPRRGRGRRVGAVTVLVASGVILMVALAATVVWALPIEYHGNTNSKVFHKPGCQHYNCPNCTKIFHSREAAIDAGYRPCKVCNP